MQKSDARTRKRRISESSQLEIHTKFRKNSVNAERNIETHLGQKTGMLG